jgi:hypothetical protein
VPLTCDVCRRRAAAGAKGWRAYLAGDFHERDEVVVFCPDCAERTFEPSSGRSGEPAA